MLEKPDISEEFIISRLREEYNLRVATLTFLPLGADMGTVVYRVVTSDGAAYFLKLRKNFDEISVAVPLFLKSQGIREIIVPLETKLCQHWADFNEYKMILYPFIEGKDGFEMELADHHRQILGKAFKKIHAVQVSPQLKRVIPRETLSPQWRESLKSFQAQMDENNSHEDPTVANLARFMKSKRDEITRLVQRAEQLALELQSRPLELVPCHTDIHGGNILISNSGELYIVDWDTPILAPKERDLMFIGGGIDKIWTTRQEEAVFYAGYGKAEVDLSALAYYRYERVIEDLVVICEQLLLTNEGGADRERSHGWFTSNFEAGSTIEIAKKTDHVLPHNNHNQLNGTQEKPR